ncbi:MAG: helix-turn-helix transcriptional regulator [Planctomycetales bacterium]|nr:helix-turn-helix transcriptional regulator [Planctomycetales bacterium]
MAKRACRIESGATLVCGEKLLQLMLANELDEITLARQAKVSEQTIRNYLSSTQGKPRKVDRAKLRAVAAALDCRLEELLIPACTEADESLVEEIGAAFFGTLPGGPADRDQVRDISGRWIVRASLLDDGEESRQGDENEPWSDEFAVEIVQAGPRFHAKMVSKSLLAKAQMSKSQETNGAAAIEQCMLVGHTMEAGDFLVGQYRFYSDSVWRYGFAMMEYQGDSIRGDFIGRNTRYQERRVRGVVECRRALGDRERDLVASMDVGESSNRLLAAAKRKPR